MVMCMKIKLVKEVLHKQGLSVQLQKRGAHLNTYYYDINNIACIVLYFHFSSYIQPEDV